MYLSLHSALQALLALERLDALRAERLHDFLQLLLTRLDLYLEHLDLHFLRMDLLVLLLERLLLEQQRDLTSSII